jgi:cellulose synthase/poly-beta-1,6-N-acetylglucosamine synthase-like glycosyltransferase
MLIEILEALFLVLAALTVVYMIRHFIFTLTALKSPGTRSEADDEKSSYRPTVSVLIPACDEEHVIGRVLQRMTELTYPKDKLQVIVIDDASRDDTGKTVDQFSKQHPFIEVVRARELERSFGIRLRILVMETVILLIKTKYWKDQNDA